jgi:hypothetical protein
VSVSNLATQTWSRWTAALAALVLVVTAVAAGAQYVVCLKTGTTHSRACCAQRQAKSAQRGPEPARFLAKRSCCEPRTLPRSGASAIEHAPPVLQAASAALVQEAWDMRLVLLRASERRAEQWRIRAGPEEAAERRARLQVFLI